MKNLLISIIIPIYNAERYLRELLDSIYNQTFLNYEVILINDGSIDKSEDVCLEYVNKDNRYKYYKKDNSGVSDTRNYGITLANGKYICFVDADDLLSADYLQIFINNISEDEVQMVCCDFQRFYDEENIKLNLNDLEEGKIKEYSNHDKFELLFSHCYGYLWNKIFVRDIILKNNIKFAKDIYMCEDMLFVFEYLKYINKVVFVDKKNYKYRIISGSASKSLRNIKWFTIFKAFEKLISENSVYDKNIFNRIMYAYIFYLYEARYRLKFIKDNSNYLNIKNDINRRIKELKKFDYNLMLKQKLKIFLYKYFNSLAFGYKKRGT